MKVIVTGLLGSFGRSDCWQVRVVMKSVFYPVRAINPQAD
jgi:hypothetical protein